MSKFRFSTDSERVNGGLAAREGEGGGGVGETASIVRRAANLKAGAAAAEELIVAHSRYNIIVLCEWAGKSHWCKGAEEGSRICGERDIDQILEKKN